ncbi:MAG: 2-hydroxyacid dehydrogenase [Candidatus Obscuribacterales bacterium]|nr:2-hydroxyacid dehydrogenase [Steroidobacteraceae bacterium]
MKPDIVVTSRMFPWMQVLLDAEFTCHRLFDVEDRGAFIKSLPGHVRGIASFVNFNVDAPLMDALPQLEIIANFGVGVDNIDLSAAQSRRIVVTNTPDVLNDCVADAALALVLNTLRKFSRAEAYLRAGEWGIRGSYPLSTSLRGKTLGILGLGRIGAAIARRAEVFGMSIRYHNRNRKDVSYPYDADLTTLAKNSDVLMVVAPGGRETDRIINASVLDALGPTGYLINIARGSLVDEPVLLKYLQEKKIAGAGLDVYADEPHVPAEFLTLDNAVLLPHVGSASLETRAAMGKLQIENLRLHFAGKEVRTRVV